MRYRTHVIPFRVSLRAGVSLFEQIVYAAKKAMVSGQLRPGDTFPSVRTLSKELKINPNTAHKIVTHLISEGLLDPRPNRHSSSRSPRFHQEGTHPIARSRD